MVSLLLAVIYLSFISLGLPDALLGAAWPGIYPQMGVPVGFAGLVSMIIAGGTVVSSLQSDRLTRLLGAGRVTAISVAATALALFGFSFSRSFWQLCLWAIPYGLGAGSVDAALNNYVALHYQSRHMSWLHCMWGIGASAGPYIMGSVMTGGGAWSGGYRVVGWIQVVLTVILFLSLPLWKSNQTQTDRNNGAPGALSLRQTLQIRGVREILLCFFCYSALEQTAGLWLSSYLSLHRGIAAETAASFAGFFFLGITLGRALSGFLSIRLQDEQMIRLGQAVLGLGLAVVLLPLDAALSLAGFALVGLGCAPIYPCIIHATPAHFGAARSQAIIGVQMAGAYVGSCFVPPLFGLLAGRLGAGLLPVFLLALLLMMVLSHEALLRRLA